ncbi:MAG: hypothetical protein ACLQU2_12445 [Candidatus Binataceae bacterium]
MKLNCVSCGHNLDLEHETYGDYHGEVKCYACGGMLQIEIEHEHVKSVKLMAPQSHHSLAHAEGCDYHGDVKCLVCGSMLQVAIENEHVKSVKLMAAAQSHHRRGNGEHRKEAR